VSYIRYSAKLITFTILYLGSKNLSIAQTHMSTISDSHCFSTMQKSNPSSIYKATQYMVVATISIPLISIPSVATDAKVSRWRRDEKSSTKGAIRCLRGGRTKKIYLTTVLLEEPYFSATVEEICRGVRIQWLKRHSPSMWWINLPKLHRLQAQDILVKAVQW